MEWSFFIFHQKSFLSDTVFVILYLQNISGFSFHLLFVLSIAILSGALAFWQALSRKGGDLMQAPYPYFRILDRFKFDTKSAQYSWVVFVKLQNNIKLGYVLTDEHSHLFHILDFPHFRYLYKGCSLLDRGMMALLIGSDTPEIGEYLALHQNTSLKQAYQKAKHIYRRLFPLSYICIEARESRDWWLFKFHTFIPGDKPDGCSGSPFSFGPCRGWLPTIYGTMCGIRISKLDAVARPVEPNMYAQLRACSQPLSFEALFAHRKKSRHRH